MRSEKEIDDMIAKLSAADPCGMASAIMALVWARGANIGGFVHSGIRESDERLERYLMSSPAQPPHAPATPPPEG